ncbi:flagellar biosynthesis protein FlgN [Buchnera aphidicola (Macrosiphoniella sanborni)]|uniref:Flagellar biosynthesis protein FlgN n=2 Tax=Buchnera aphidicola TaxID=9 RepID=A0A4D6Y3N6_9GAMM|nr:flagellar biosynthesis protein FlgN [Buchnera aphidicola (Macrosiphoniella sanborni)]
MKNKKLVNTVKKIEKVLNSIEIILKKEYNFLINFNQNIYILDTIIQEKKRLFKTYSILNQEKLLLEKINSIYPPYNSNIELKNYSSNFIKKSFILRDLNNKNKVLMNKNFYLNQYFLELFISYKAALIYDKNGDLKKLN